jgi:hypothetical protein
MYGINLICSLLYVSKIFGLNLMFRWPCIIVYQHSETNMMQFLFNLLRIKGLYMFRALIAHPQEVLHKLHLVYCVRIMSSSTPILVQPTDITRTKYAKCRLCSASWGWASNARNIQRHLILNKQNKKCITLVSLYWWDVYSEREGRLRCGGGY